MSALVEVRELAVGFPVAHGLWQRAVDGVSLEVQEREAVALVGESGCGKTLSALALIHLVPAPARVTAERLRVAGTDVLSTSEERLCRLRGGMLGYVFQEPSQALNPVMRIGPQVAEAARLHLGLRGGQLIAVAETLLAEVGLDRPREVARAFPHQLSGGQRQRVLIASALSANPGLLIADEPTSALDALSAAALVGQLAGLRSRRELALVLISHDLQLVERAVDRVCVLYAGETVEWAPRRELFENPLHPYTAALVKAAPRGVRAPGERLPAIPGSVPAALERGPGCRFAPRCPLAFPRCRSARPALVTVAGGRKVRCFLHSNAEQGDG
ncbi:MAG: ABC transporter ATP-binding protein [Acidobacteriota bacterium]